MSKLPRLSISLTEPQRAFLEKEARHLGISVADLIRRIVDQYREKHRL
jgi:Ribbon-helix-helix protein, copG family